MLVLGQSVEKVILKINQETKKKFCTGLYILNYIALQWILCFVLRPWRLRYGHVFFLPDRPTPTFPDKKKTHMTEQFFLF